MTVFADDSGVTRVTRPACLSIIQQRKTDSLFSPVMHVIESVATDTKHQVAHNRLSIRGIRVVESVAKHNAARDTNSSVTENGSAAIEDLRYTGISSVQVSTKMS